MKKVSFLTLFLIPYCAFAASDDCMTRTTVPSERLNLPQVIELGLCRNPQTTASYLAYESARLSKNANYADYLPSVNASASASLPYRNKEWGDWSYGASLSASYLIFDFGKRLADLNQSAAAWRATGFDYDETVQNYIYSLIGSYYALLNADADVKSAEMLRTVAQTARDTAQKKFKAGAVAKADVLKADTTLASRDLDLERAKNNREIAKGTLLNKLSFPASQNIEIADLPSEIGAPQETKTLDELFAQAEKTRPDLLRATANKDSAWHRRNSVFLSNLPSISASGSVSWNDTPSETYGAGNDKISGSIGIRASMPLFAGFANLYNARAAQVNYDRAIEQERATQDNATLDVFTAYQNYKTAQTVLKQTETLLKSATESERVTAGMYKVGRATMLDWQTAQSELVSAEKQNNAARYDLFTKRAAVALAVGEIKAELEEGKHHEENN
ncbi:MAG: TolC family protein [Alphaproteobacteria bacterium]|nr:TolC family protein [Alphaproteobacteria bacterium]